MRVSRYMKGTMIAPKIEIRDLTKGKCYKIISALPHNQTIAIYDDNGVRRTIRAENLKTWEWKCSGKSEEEIEKEEEMCEYNVKRAAKEADSILSKIMDLNQSVYDELYGVEELDKILSHIEKYKRRVQFLKLEKELGSE